MIVDQIKIRKKEIKLLFTIIIILGVVFIAYKEFANIDFKELFKHIRQIPLTKEIQILIFGVGAFSLTSLYDLLFSKYYDFNLNRKTALKIGWISQAFANFVGLGPPIRYKLYRKEGIDSKNSLKISVSIFFTSLTGLSVLIAVSLFSASKLGSSNYLYILAIACIYIPVFLFIDKVDFKKLFKLNLSIEHLNKKTKFLGMGLSTIEWLVVAIFFAYLVRLFTPTIPYSTIILVYCVSMLLGLLSFLPGGFGSFDISCIYLFGKMGYETKYILISIIIYRIVYYVIPWLISIFILAFEFIKEKGEVQDQNKITKELGVNALYYGILSAGIILILSSATPSIVNRLEVLRDVIPKDFQYLSRVITMLIGVMLISLSKGIKERVRIIHHISIALLLLATVTSVLKGLDYEESILMIFLAILLYLSKSSFDKESMRFNKRNLLGNLLIFTLVPLSYFIVFNLTHGVNMINSTDKYSLAYLSSNKSNIYIYILLTSIISLILQFSISKKLTFTKISDEDISKFSKFIEIYGGNIYSHLFYLKDKNIFLNKNENVMLMYRPYKNKLFVLGDPIGDRNFFEDAIDEFIEFAGDYNMTVVFYEVEGKNLELYNSQGFNFIKIGEEAIVDLTSFSYEGKENKVLRHMRNMFVNRNYELEVIDPPFTDEFLDMLKGISDQWLNGRLEKKFSLGFFDKEYVSRAPVAILKQEDEVIAFCTLMPSYDDGTISIDLMRMKKDHPNGTMDCLFISLMSYMKDKGYKKFNLGGAPLSNVGNKKKSLKKEKLIKYGYDFGNNIYNFHGLRHYKEKFKPDWIGRYVAYYDEIKLPSTLIDLIKIINSQA